MNHLQSVEVQCIKELYETAVLEMLFRYNSKINWSLFGYEFPKEEGKPGTLGSVRMTELSDNKGYYRFFINTDAVLRHTSKWEGVYQLVVGIASHELGHLFQFQRKWQSGLPVPTVEEWHDENWEVEMRRIGILNPNNYEDYCTIDWYKANSTPEFIKNILMKKSRYSLRSKFRSIRAAGYQEHFGDSYIPGMELKIRW